MIKTSSANHLWFLNSLVTIRVSESDGQDRISVLEHRMRFGDSPPLHLHRTEDELFQILVGDFRLRVGDQEHRVSAGDVMLVHKGVPHTYRVESPEGGRLLTVTVGGDFERFVRVMARPAERLELPEPAGPPPQEAIEFLARTAARYGIEILGPPLQ